MPLLYTTNDVGLTYACLWGSPAVADVVLRCLESSRIAEKNRPCNQTLSLIAPISLSRRYIFPSQAQQSAQLHRAVPGVGGRLAQRACIWASAPATRVRFPGGHLGRRLSPHMWASWRFPWNRVEFQRLGRNGYGAQSTTNQSRTRSEREPVACDVTPPRAATQYGSLQNCGLAEHC